MHSTIKSTTSLYLTLGALALLLSFQNCAKAKFDIDSSSVALKSGDQGDDVNLTIPIPPSTAGNDTSTPTNTQTTTVVTTGGGGTCPAFGSVGSSVSINISSKAMASVRPTVSRCATIDMADVKIMLDQIIASGVVIGSLKGQYLTRDNSISFVAAESVSDVDSVLLVLLKSGHQFMSSKSEIKSMGLKDVTQKKLAASLSQRTSFEKGRTYTLHLQVTESSSLVDDGSQCLLKPVLEVQ